jgi:NADH:ubiquinone oxidoreductase subunit F (NADH-binding)
MIESIEGKRGMPRLRPPYVAQVGLFGRPTLEHNFETLYWVRDIVEKGAAWFAGHGRHGRKGLRSSRSVGPRARAGRQAGAGRHHAARADRRVLRRHAPATASKAYLPGGASGGILPARWPTCRWTSTRCSRTAASSARPRSSCCRSTTRARDAARNLMRFFEHESCGQCTPCRVGTAKAAALIDAAALGPAAAADLSQVMRDASICGLGQAAPNPVRLRDAYFRDEVAHDDGARK